MLAAIEIYNKPLFNYRDECFCILLINAWELLAKAILSKNRQRIMYTKKEAGVSYRTYSLTDSLRKAKPYFPENTPYEPIRANIQQIVEFRDNATHYYNETGFGVMIYGLAQAAIITYKDLLLTLFNYDITEDVTIVLLPLGFGAMPDPVQFLRSKHTKVPRNKVVASFLRSVIEITKKLEDQGYDLQRFLTRFDANLVSVKKFSHADIVVGIDGTLHGTETSVTVEKIIDPNKKFPIRRKDLLEKIGHSLNGAKFNQYTLNAIIFKYKIKENDNYYWKAISGGAMQFSPEFVTFLRTLTSSQIDECISAYRDYQRKKRMLRKR